jgi:radical SAM superfamily enzyme YgiQ (UPF0313 family)
MFDRHILGNFPVQFVIRGEAEIALAALCRALENNQSLSEVPNLSWRDAEGRIMRNALGPLIPKHKLALFPLPDYSELPVGVYRALSIESSRGCAFDCAFCSTSYRRSWRAIPAESFVDRLASAMEHLDRVQHPIVHMSMTFQQIPRGYWRSYVTSDEDWRPNSCMTPGLRTCSQTVLSRR